MPDTAFYTKHKVGTRRRSLSHGAPGMHAGGSSEQNEDFVHESPHLPADGNRGPAASEQKASKHHVNGHRLSSQVFTFTRQRHEEFPFN